MAFGWVFPYAMLNYFPYFIVSLIITIILVLIIVKSFKTKHTGWAIFLIILAIIPVGITLYFIGVFLLCIVITAMMVWKNMFG